MTQSALDRALQFFDGNQSKFAAAIGTSQQLVSYWVNKRSNIPAEFVLETERQTGISRHDLRPDIYPREDAA